MDYIKENYISSWQCCRSLDIRPRFFFLPESGDGYDAAHRGAAGADLKGHPHNSFWHALDDG